MFKLHLRAQQVSYRRLHVRITSGRGILLCARTKLEPYLGFLHSVQYGKPSLVCDLQELYRHLMDDFVIQLCQGVGKKDFTVKRESISRSRRGKREYLNDAETRLMMKNLNDYFESKVNIPLIRHGTRQRIETLINEEVLLLAKYLRGDMKTWIPRIIFN